MKNFVKLFPLFIVMMLIFGVNDADAQRRGGDKEVEDYFDEGGGFEHRLWYGGNVGLNLSSQTFFVALEPMVGYKIMDFLSVGPRLSYQYNRQIAFNCGQEVNFKGTTYGVGLFTRVKFLESFFLHGEYMSINRPNVYYSGSCLALDPNNNSNLDIVRVGDSQMNIGAGYSSGGIFAYEMMIYYDVLVGDNEFIIPWGFRAGVTYKFFQ